MCREWSKGGRKGRWRKGGREGRGREGGGRRVEEGREGGREAVGLTSNVMLISSVILWWTRIRVQPSVGLDLIRIRTPLYMTAFLKNRF